jgi:hypothetical protein
MRPNLRHTAFLVTLLAAAGVCLRGAQPAAPAPCPDCLKARYWQIDPLDYEKTGDASFPETELLKDWKDRLDLGIAFSGGGTRSATASLGYLRGLQRLGWLSRVKYVSAVSGGGWAAIPFVYSKQPLEDFLGVYEAPESLDVDRVKNVAVGSLGLAIAQSSLVSSSIREGTSIFLNFRARLQEAPNPLLKEIVWLTNRVRREGGRDDKTYARMLGSIFVSDSLVQKGATSTLFSWTTKTIADMMSINPGKLPQDFVVPHAMTPPGQPPATLPDRPFLIASGTMVSGRRDYDYPLLMPMEYTPMYVGVRQTFGLFGGTYVWPWAFDPLAVGQATPDPDASTTHSGLVEVKVDLPARAFTLADMAASTGAAPEIPALVFASHLDEPFKRYATIASTFFPAFHHYAIRDPNHIVLTEAIPHGDGGGIENTGVMPLLARHVHNIMVFNNTQEPCVENNSDLRVLFLPGAAPDNTSDTRGDQVFAPEKWEEVKNALVAKREQGLPQVYCASKWSVLKNARYNVRHYEDLNICFVYNAASADWHAAIAKKPAVLALITDPKKPDPKKVDPKKVDPIESCRPHDTGPYTQNFPYFATFEQNKPHLIQLTTQQVNLFSNLTAWTIANESTVNVVRRAMKDLPCPPGMTCMEK